jgi:hypothetical protein
MGISKNASGISPIRTIVNGTDVGSTNLGAPTALATGDPFQVGGVSVGGLGLARLNAGVAWGFWLQGVSLSAAAIDAYLNDPEALVEDYGPDGAVVPDALKLFWTMQGDQATEVDQSGVGNDGTRTGTVAFETEDGPTPTTDWDPFAAGPVIVTHPVNQKVIRTNGTTVGASIAYTAAPDTTIVAVGVERETSPGVWEDAEWDVTFDATSAAASLAGVVTGDAGTYRFGVLDSAAAVSYSNTFTVSVFDGPQGTAFGATAGDGTSTSTVISDYVTQDGEAIADAVELPDGTLRITTTTTAP